MMSYFQVQNKTMDGIRIQEHNWLNSQQPRKDQKLMTNTTPAI